MPRASKLRVMTLFVAGALAADALVGCLAESEPAPSLNPQPLPPGPPPSEDDEGPEHPPPASDGDPSGDGLARDASSDSSGSSSVDAGGD